LTVGTLVREFFEETHVPILYIDMDTYLPKLKLPPDARSKALYGAHCITGRIENLLLKGDYGPKESQPAGAVPENTGLATLGKLGFSGSLTLGSWIPDLMAHGGGREPALPTTAAEREQWGKQGQAQIIAIVRQMRLGEAMDALKQHDKFTREVLVPKFGIMLPTPNDSH
jgi:hypothetical protein